MIVVDPMPNEPAVAHLGRLAWIRGCTSTELEAQLKRECKEYVEEPLMHHLAKHCGRSGTDYAKQHSMLGVMCVAAKSDAIHPYGSAEAILLSHQRGMKTQRRGAFVCKQCAKEDLEHWHFSWYRRSHHLSGVDWCLLHNQTLWRVQSMQPFDEPPHSWVEQGLLEMVSARSPELPNTGFLRTYAEVSTAFLNRERPYKVATINRCLSRRAHEMGFRVSVPGKRPLVSDLVEKLAPSQWIMENQNSWKKKKVGEYFFPLDHCLLSRARVVSGEQYAIVMAALYSSADDALSDIQKFETETTLNLAQHSSRSDERYWHGEIWPLYLSCKGDVREMSSLLQIDKVYLMNMMRKLGLPSLDGLEELPKWRALVQLWEGQDFSTTCDIEGVSRSEMIDLLIQSSARAAIAAKQCLSYTSAKQTSYASLRPTVDVSIPTLDDVLKATQLSP